ncbi:hypothetical protein [Maribacter sp. 2307ULW6-5]|uniref:hypothetical protein n=1 Tax=Maribacter sp. 2307ULW6-5 TaxID=3386275 RepID=UPI0039BC9F86
MYNTLGSKSVMYLNALKTCHTSLKALLKNTDENSSNPVLAFSDTISSYIVQHPAHSILLIRANLDRHSHSQEINEVITKNYREIKTLFSVRFQVSKHANHSTHVSLISGAMYYDAFLNISLLSITNSLSKSDLNTICCLLLNRLKIPSTL